jgi:hypothetical protein
VGLLIAAGGCGSDRPNVVPSAETTPWLVPAKQMELLGSTDVRTRTLAARNLGNLGSAAAEAIPALEKLRDDKDPKVRQAVDEALEKIRGKQDAGGKSP